MQEKTGSKFKKYTNGSKTIKKLGVDGVGTTTVLAWATGPIFILYLKDHLDAPSQNLWHAPHF